MIIENYVSYNGLTINISNVDDGSFCQIEKDSVVEFKVELSLNIQTNSFLFDAGSFSNAGIGIYSYAILTSSGKLLKRGSIFIESIKDNTLALMIDELQKINDDIKEYEAANFFEGSDAASSGFKQLAYNEKIKTRNFLQARLDGYLKQKLNLPTIKIS